MSVGENVLDTQLSNRLAGIPGVSADLIANVGSTDIIDIVGTQYRAATLEAYNDSLRVVFQVALIMACLTIPGALAMEWRTVKKKGPPKKPDGEQAVEKDNCKHDAEKGNAEQSADNGRSQGNVSEQEALAINAADEEKHESRDADVMRPTASSEAVRTNSQSEVKSV